MEISNNCVSDQHIFALFVPQISTIITQSSLATQQIITDVHVVHRIQHVLRLTRGTQFILFDRTSHIDCIFEVSNKKNVTFTVSSVKYNDVLQPSITCLLPMLKRESLEIALYSLTELGATTICLVQTQKSNNRWDVAKDLERLKRVMYAAAEQSKNYAFPELVPPCPLPDVLNAINLLNSKKIFFDPAGCSLESVLVPDSVKTPIVVAFGPEGDLTVAEKELMLHNGFVFCRLTPTILRAHQAITVGVGMMRTLMS